MSRLLPILCILVLFAACDAQVQGLWYWTWSSGVSLGSTNLCVAFSGWVDPDSALPNSVSTLPNLVGEKFLGLGGGNSNGYWTSTVIQKIASYCSAGTSGQFSGYTGIAFDIEEGDAGLESSLQSAFAACKSNGFKVLVTVSHSAPYGISDGATLMQAIISDTNVDYLSPQLYTTGSETANDYTTSGVNWSQYAQSSAQIIPSIVTGTYYSSAQTYFQSNGVTTAGYVQWSQTVTDGITGGSSSSTSSSSGTSVTTRCGSDWTTASSQCLNACTVNSDCASGYQCFANLNPCVPPTSTPSTLPSSTGTASTTRCGPDWTTASSQCQNTCSVDGDCAAGNHCYANLNPCSSSAVSENSNSFDSSSADRLTPLQIGLIVGICCLVVAAIAIVIVIVVQRKKIQERV